MQTRTKIAVLLLMLAAAGVAQRRFGGGGCGLPEREDGPRPEFPKQSEFHFVRLEYTDLPQFHRRFGFASRAGRGEGWWMVDWPDAEDHFSSGVQRLTRVHTGDPIHFRLTDPQLFDNPWIYATQTGWWDLSNAEAAKLGEYLQRGGFLVVDDMWGPAPDQWEVFTQTMRRTLPGTQITDILEHDSVMHVVYDILEKDRSFIPGTRHLRFGARGQLQWNSP